MTNCIIAEDEDLLRVELAKMLGEVWPELEIVAQCEDGGEALEAIAEHRPAIAFLDIRMPGLNGLQVAAALSEASPETAVVFVTAYDQYAIDAFEKGAIDYLLKPVSRERLKATVERLKSRLGRPPAERPRLEALLEDLGARLARREAPLAWITASAGRETRLIMIDDVVYFQADNKYTGVMTADAELLIRKPIRDLLRELDPTHFRQIHRATVVNLRAIASVSRDDNGKARVKLKNRPEVLTVSAPFMALFRGM